MQSTKPNKIVGVGLSIILFLVPEGLNQLNIHIPVFGIICLFSAGLLILVVAWHSLGPRRTFLEKCLISLLIAAALICLAYGPLRTSFMSGGTKPQPSGPRDRPAPEAAAAVHIKPIPAPVPSLKAVPRFHKTKTTRTAPTEAAKPPVQPAEPTSLVQNIAPGGFATSGGTLINPTVNNYKDLPPPPRIISGINVRSAIATLQSAPAAKVRFTVVGSTEEIKTFSNSVAGIFKKGTGKLGRRIFTARQPMALTARL